MSKKPASVVRNPGPENPISETPPQNPPIAQQIYFCYLTFSVENDQFIAKFDDDFSGIYYNSDIESFIAAFDPDAPDEPDGPLDHGPKGNLEISVKHSAYFVISTKEGNVQFARRNPGVTLSVKPADRYWGLNHVQQDKSVLPVHNGASDNCRTVYFRINPSKDGTDDGFNIHLEIRQGRAYHFLRVDPDIKNDGRGIWNDAEKRRTKGKIT